MLTYLHGDPLGSASLATNASGTKITDNDTRYYPYGATRPGLAGTGLPTDRRFTGQRDETGLGFYDYGARQYDPALGRFLQADSIILGAASGAGGGAATLGYDSHTRLTPLTVNLGEFVAQVNAENQELLQFGPFSQWDSHTRQEHPLPMGPANPQALNRYAYVLNNPLQYIDPTGHSVSLTVIGIFALSGSVGSGIGYVAVQTTMQRPIDLVELGVAMGVGAVAGALTPVASFTGLVGIGAGANIVNEVLPALIKGESIDPTTIAVAGILGAIFGLADGALPSGGASAVQEYMESVAIIPLAKVIGPASAQGAKVSAHRAFEQLAKGAAYEGLRTAGWDAAPSINLESFKACFR